VDEHDGGHVFLGLEDSGSPTGVSAYYFGYIIVYVVSLHYLLVFSDDRVIQYTRVDDVVGGAGEV